jgi:ATP-dependent RNA helicase DeaD
VVIEALAGEFDVMDVALAAVKLAHEAEGGDKDEGEDIPTPRREPDRGDRRNVRPPLSGGHIPGGVARLFFNAGREAGITPRDLVGAITNQADLSGREIRGIEITDRFSLVDVPEEAADHVIESLNGARIRGRKIHVRRDRRDGDRR